MPPNQIHFDTVFDNLEAKIADNYAVIIALGAVYFLYFVGLVWARRMDRKDVEKVCYGIFSAGIGFEVGDRWCRVRYGVCARERERGGGVMYG